LYASGIENSDFRQLLRIQDILLQFIGKGHSLPEIDGIEKGLLLIRLSERADLLPPFRRGGILHQPFQKRRNLLLPQLKKRCLRHPPFKKGGRGDFSAHVKQNVSNGLLKKICQKTMCYLHELSGV